MGVEERIIQEGGVRIVRGEERGGLFELNSMNGCKGCGLLL